MNREKVGLAVSGMETRKLHTEEEKSWSYYGCSLSPGIAAQISHALHWDKKVI